MSTTNVPKQADRGGKDPDSKAHEELAGTTADDLMVDAKSKPKSGPLQVQGREDTLPENSEAASGSMDGTEDESKPFDFGGLPDRNLKRNLGCG